VKPAARETLGRRRSHRGCPTRALVEVEDDGEPDVGESAQQARFEREATLGPLATEDPAEDPRLVIGCEWTERFAALLRKRHEILDLILGLARPPALLRIQLLCRRFAPSGVRRETGSPRSRPLLGLPRAAVSSPSESVSLETVSDAVYSCGSTMARR
jgi:hypothetical protein